MELGELKKNWHEFGRRDPLWAILAEPDKMNNRWDVAEFFRTGEVDVAAILKRIEEVPFKLNRGRALDFGCGVGRLTQALAERFEECYGVDIARSMIRLAKKHNRHGRRCRYLLNERNDLRSFRNDTFDFICTLITLQHMKPEYSRRYILEFLRVLRPGGILFFQLPAGYTASNPLANQSAHQEEEATQEARPPVRRSLVQDIYEKAAELYRSKVSPEQFDPVMEMHFVPRDEVLKLIEEGGGRLVHLQDDFSCGPDWLSFRYFVTK